MFLWIRNLFTVRKAIFKWESNLGNGTVKVLFRGSFSQYEARLEAVQELMRILRDPDEILESVDFVGIEE